MFQVSFQAEAHVRPALTVPIRALQTGFRRVPFALGYLHKRLVRVQWFETHLDDSIVSTGFWYLSSFWVKEPLASLPGESN